jgi:hypothetical protein
VYYHSLDQIHELLPSPEAWERQQAFEQSSGLPWSLTLDELKDRYGGVQSWRNFQDVIFLPEDPPILGLGSVRFHHPYHAHMNNWPCHRFEGNYFDLGNHRKNHEALIGHFARLFGFRPNNEDVSNCLCADWRFGLFQVELHSFIPKETKRFSDNNELYKAHPELWEATWISIEAHACANRTPDDSLAAAIAAPDSGFQVLDQPRTRMSNGHFLFNRLLPTSLKRSRTTEGYRFWKDTTRLGIASSTVAIAVPRTLVKNLALHETEAGRSSESCALALVLQDEEVELLLHEGSMTGLREVAAKASRLFDLPLATQQHAGDC